MEIVLRGWASQNVEQMPRLRYWTFACFFALAAMGLPLAASRWLLRPGTDEHKALLARLPEGVRSMWAEILTSRGEAIKQLESTRSRLTLFADCGILRRMFGVAQNRFDVARFIEERRIVLVNVGSYGILDQQIGKTIGGFVVNEVIQTAMSLTSKEVNPTYLVLDEFQHFVGPDLYDALPLVRQLGLRLILAHQSFSQLVRGDIDLTGIIWQARSRLMFANSAMDASIIAEELAKLTHDPYRLKDLLTSERQLIVDYRRELMKSTSTTHSDSTAKESGSSHADGASTGASRAPGVNLPTTSTGRQSSAAHSQSEKTGHADAHGEAVSEALVPVHKNFQEVSSKTFFSFEEQQLEWERRVRELHTGYAFGTFKDDPKLYHLKITEQKTVETPRAAANTFARGRAVPCLRQSLARTASAKFFARTSPAPARGQSAMAIEQADRRVVRAATSNQVSTAPQVGADDAPTSRRSTSRQSDRVPSRECSRAANHGASKMTRLLERWCRHELVPRCPISCACRSQPLFLFEENACLSPLRRRLGSHCGAENVCPQTVPDPGPALVPEVVPDPVPALGRPGTQTANEDVCCMLFAHQPFRGSPGCLGGASSPWLVSYVIVMRLPPVDVWLRRGACCEETNARL